MRLPRKLKKKAKKRKALHDAMVMTHVAMVKAMGQSQVMKITVIPPTNPHHIALKALYVVEVVTDTAKAVSNCMSQIKHYREFV